MQPHFDDKHNLTSAFIKSYKLSPLKIASHSRLAYVLTCSLRVEFNYFHLLISKMCLFLGRHNE